MLDRFSVDPVAVSVTGDARLVATSPFLCCRDPAQGNTDDLRLLVGEVDADTGRRAAHAAARDAGKLF